MTIVPPPTPGTEAAKAAGVQSGSAPGDVKAGKGKQPKYERPDELLPALVVFIYAHRRATKPKLVESFLERYPGRAISKAWLGEKVSELAEKKGGVGWVLKPSAVDKVIGGDDSGR